MSLITIVIQSIPGKDSEVELKTFSYPPLPVNEPAPVDAAQSLAITMLNAVTDNVDTTSKVDHAA